MHGEKMTEDDCHASLVAEVCQLRRDVHDLHMRVVSLNANMNRFLSITIALSVLYLGVALCLPNNNKMRMLADLLVDYDTGDIMPPLPR